MAQVYLERPYAYVPETLPHLVAWDQLPRPSSAYEDVLMPPPGDWGDQGPRDQGVGKSGGKGKGKGKGRRHRTRSNRKGGKGRGKGSPHPVFPDAGHDRPSEAQQRDQASAQAAAIRDYGRVPGERIPWYLKQRMKKRAQAGGAPPAERR